MEINLNRLTSSKHTSEMGMFELAHNSCYAENGIARYRDYDIDIDARKLAIQLLDKFADIPNEFTCDDDFDEQMIDYLQYGFDSIEGLIAIFYRNLWAMADLHEKLKYYEDLAEQNRLIELPCQVGQKVYLKAPCEYVVTKMDYETGVVKCPFEDDCEYEECDDRNERIFETTVESIFNDRDGQYIDLHKMCIEIPVSDFGKTIFLTRKEAEQELNRKEKVYDKDN